MAQLHAAQVGDYDFWQSQRRVIWTSAFSVLLVTASYAVGLPDEIDRRASALLASFGSAAAAAVGISTAQLVLGAPLLPRFVVFSSVIFAAVWGMLSSALTQDLQGRTADATKVVLIGDDSEAEQLISELKRSAEKDARIVGNLHADDAHEQLKDLVEKTNAQFVALDRRAQENDKLLELVAEMHRGGLRIRTLSLFYEEWLGKLPISELQRVSLMFDVGEVHRTYYGRQKRVFDILCGSVLLPVTLIIGLALFILNVAFNRGSLFFSQRRVGRNEIHFTIHKFRTMVNKTGTAAWTVDGDGRITAFGRFLRRSHIDELPQCWNLLRGDISLVGPRPEQPSYVEQLREEIPFYEYRHLVRPGITGWAQVKFHYAASVADTRESSNMTSTTCAARASRWISESSFVPCAR